MRVQFTWVIVLISSIAAACYWDMDTLSMEAKGMPGTVDAIVGRFERNPDLYYEMRVARVTVAVAETPDDLNLYDDLAIANDRLGRSDEAFEWLEKKHALLTDTDPDRLRKDDWYRYFANIGTVRVHKWLRDGGPEDRIEELEQAISEIGEAVAINPDAHFGREWVQLGLMRSVLSVKTRQSERSVRDELYAIRKNRTRDEITEAVTGLITLGAAWESPDVLLLLRTNEIAIVDSTIAALAYLRTEELLSEGRTHLLGEDVDGLTYAVRDAKVNGQSEKSLREAYSALRKNAAEYHEHRTAYMMERLSKGEHPDTHADFWNDYEEYERVDLQQFDPLIPRRLYQSPIAYVVFSILGFVGLPVTVFLIVRRWRKKQRSSESSLPPVA